MSTRSRIIIELSNDDKNKDLVVNPKMFEDCVLEHTIKERQPINTNAKYISIYHHFDGYPEGVGQTLLDEFNDYDKALNLILLGNCSYIIDSIKNYYDWRDELWEDNKPLESDNLENEDWSCGIEWVYLFRDGKWYVAEPKIDEDTDEGKWLTKMSDFMPLFEVLDNIEKE